MIVFVVNVPIGLATAVATRRLIVRDAGAGLHGGADVPGGVLVTGALMLAVSTIVVVVVPRRGEEPAGAQVASAAA